MWGPHPTVLGPRLQSPCPHDLFCVGCGGQGLVCGPCGTWAPGSHRARHRTQGMRGTGPGPCPCQSCRLGLRGAASRVLAGVRERFTCAQKCEGRRGGSEPSASLWGASSLCACVCVPACACLCVHVSVCASSCSYAHMCTWGPGGARPSVTAPTPVVGRRGWSVPPGRAGGSCGPCVYLLFTQRSVGASGGGRPSAAPTEVRVRAGGRMAQALPQKWAAWMGRPSTVGVVRATLPCLQGPP